MPILNYTTKIEVSKTISEINATLTKAGAERIMQVNDENKNPSAIQFSLTWRGKPVAFELPCKFEGVLKSMQNNRKVPRHQCTKEQALRVGWRIIKVWIDAQMAIVEAEVAELAEVFLPYALTNTGKTLFKNIEENPTLLLSQ